MDYHIRSSRVSNARWRQRGNSLDVIQSLFNVAVVEQVELEDGGRVGARQACSNSLPSSRFKFVDDLAAQQTSA